MIIIKRFYIHSHLRKIKQRIDFDWVRGNVSWIYKRLPQGNVFHGFSCLQEEEDEEVC